MIGSFDAGTLIGTGGAKYGQPCSVYAEWGVLHKTCCDGPCAYHPLGPTSKGERPTLTTHVPPSSYAGRPQNASVSHLTKGAYFNPPLKSFAAQTGTSCAVVSGENVSYGGDTETVSSSAPPPPPLAPIMPPLVTLDGLGPSNSDVVLGGSSQVDCDGCLVGASDLFENQVPMFSRMKPFTAPVEGTLLPDLGQPPFLGSGDVPRALVPTLGTVGAANDPGHTNQIVALVLIGLLVAVIVGYLWWQYARA